ncbi:hypothetical protein L218DRAFT_951187 [Marasmius fiardii PR-910]|nr:hypothetical protein L218DRAFT_951187 [Marasmius fiardii PR-910]
MWRLTLALAVYSATRSSRGLLSACIGGGRLRPYEAAYPQRPFSLIPTLALTAPSFGDPQLIRFLIQVLSPFTSMLLIRCYSVLSLSIHWYIPYYTGPHAEAKPTEGSMSSDQGTGYQGITIFQTEIKWMAHHPNQRDIMAMVELYQMSSARETSDKLAIFSYTQVQEIPASEMDGYQLSFILWTPLQLTALVGFLLIQLTTFFGGLFRGRVWYCFMLSFTIFCFSNCLLYIGGQQPENSQQLEPNHALCVAQATLVYSDNSLKPLRTMLTMLSLFLELYWTVLSVGSENKMALERRAKSPLFCITKPSNVKIGLVMPYCSLYGELVPRTFTFVTTLIPLAATMILLANRQHAPLPTVMIASRLVKTSKGSTPSPTLREHTVVFIRFAIIWITGLVSVIFMMILLAVDPSPKYCMYNYVVRTIVPWIVMVVFGSQRDILLVWAAVACRVLKRLQSATKICRQRDEVKDSQ